MPTNTYRLAVALQAKAIDSIDLHAGGFYTAAHSFGENITVVARYRTGADQRILQMWAHDADAHLLGSAEARTPRAAAAHRQPRHRIPRRSSALGTPHHPHRRAVPQPRRARHRARRTPARRRSGSTPVAAPTTTSATTGHPGARHATPPGRCSSEPRAEV